ncbi:MAG: L-threonylcarbamoyladenylate synthase [Gemmatimonadetes bacterium]|nr:L-threonylcarbamoyladenylate synthase [Gemmatimonadota bacterium]NNK49154.1 L-threonylcarbamoyladenylate synthase [Gemmatimonadota bacterium]
MARYESAAVAGETADLAPAVLKAVAVLRAGGMLAHPTETVYGIGGAVRPDVDDRIGRLKGRSVDQAPILRIALDAPTLQRAFPELVWPPAARRLAQQFWPGPLTLVLEGDSGTSTAVRAEGHPVMRAVLEAWGGPMGSTSLNLSGEPPAVTADQAARTLHAMPDVRAAVLLLDAGDLRGPPPSTLVSFVGSGPSVLRDGAVPRRLIESYCEEANS